MPVTPDTDGVIMMKDDISWEDSLCINCGECSNICPRGLSPHCLYAAVGEGRADKYSALGLEKCLECGLCSFVCPSRLHLLHQIKVGKTMGKGKL